MDIEPASGGYLNVYRAFSIKFPYMTSRYLYFGAKSGAVEFAESISAAKKYPYKPSIRELKI